MFYPTPHPTAVLFPHFSLTAFPSSSCWPSTTVAYRSTTCRTNHPHKSSPRPCTALQPLRCILLPPTNRRQYILRPTRPGGPRVTVALEYISTDCAIVIIRTDDFTSPADSPPVLLTGTAAATHIPRYKNRFRKVLISSAPVGTQAPLATRELTFSPLAPSRTSSNGHA